ncbi:hypothetical protein GEV33_009672 [Tenebrio molitor]|uniref:Uncharacterized protein n=1 Tax=Tenebrio molitor TaxID=7067 RepID=A0A8J6HED4_TENMO|nr:hypothetical protein GEV33_009672 [Tenebrio molitor]
MTKFNQNKKISGIGTIHSRMESSAEAGADAAPGAEWEISPATAKFFTTGKLKSRKLDRSEGVPHGPTSRPILFSHSTTRQRTALRIDINVPIGIERSPSTVAKRLARHFTFGRSRVLTPVPPDQVWVFFRDFPTPSHRGMSHITDKANAGSVSTSQYLPPSFRTHPHRTHPESSHVPFPFLIERSHLTPPVIGVAVPHLHKSGDEETRVQKDVKGEGMGKMVGNLARYDVVPDVYSARYGWNNNAPLYLPFCIQGGIFIRDFYSIGSSRYNKTAPSERFRFRNADINKSNSPKNATPGEPGRINQSFDWKPSPRNYDIVVDEARSEKFQ